MFVNISNIMMTCYPISAIQLRMIGWELIQNNNIICIFMRKLTYIQLNKYDPKLQTNSSHFQSAILIQWWKIRRKVCLLCSLFSG